MTDLNNIKVCSKCKIKKKLFCDFYKSSQTKNGFSCWCKKCDSEKQKLKQLKKNGFDAPATKISICIKCGIFTKFISIRYETRCESCVLEAKKIAHRKLAEKYDRQRGVKKVKGTEIICIDCNIVFIRNSIRAKRCVTCRDINYLALANKRSWEKSRLKGARVVGSIDKCGHCNKDFIIKGTRSKYCDDCLILQKTQKLPHLIEAKEKWVKKNKNKIKQKNIEYREVNKEKLNLYRKEKYHTKQKYNIFFMFKTRVKNLIRSSIKNKKYSNKKMYREIIGCDWVEFKNHIEKQFTKSMTWENRSEWHIDHIVPLASAKTEDDVIRLNHYTNLRPLWAADNLKKSDNMDYLI